MQPLALSEHDLHADFAFNVAGGRYLLLCFFGTAGGAAGPAAASNGNTFWTRQNTRPPSIPKAIFCTFTPFASESIGCAHVSLEDAEGRCRFSPYTSKR
jgi:hypothetical protein